MGYQPHNLTPGERLWVFRSRLGFTQEQMAVDFGVGTAEYVQMEYDGSGPSIKYVSIRYLTKEESLSLLHRRTRVD